MGGSWICIIFGPDHFMIILFDTDCIIKILSQIITNRYVQVIIGRSLSYHFFGCFQCCFVIWGSHFRRNTDFISFCAYRSNHLIIVVGQWSCINGSTCLQHQRSPTCGTGGIGGGLCRQVICDSGTFIDDIIVDFWFFGTGNSQTWNIHPCLIFVYVIIHNRYTA